MVGKRKYCSGVFYMSLLSIGTGTNTTLFYMLGNKTILLYEFALMSNQVMATATTICPQLIDGDIIIT